MCHKHQFERYCGTEAAGVMDVLLRRAMYDPVILRYGYRPHCAYHTTPTTPQQTTLTLSTAPVTSERPSTVDSTTNDELTELTSVENWSSVTVEADSRQWRTGVHSNVSGAEHRCITLNVLIVTSLLSGVM